MRVTKAWDVVHVGNCMVASTSLYLGLPLSRYKGLSVNIPVFLLICA
jgi:hypothetical protein